MTACRSCGTPIVKFLSLGRMPLVNSFLQKKDIRKERRYDLSVGFCQKCFLVQLMSVIDPKELFRHYLYFSSATNTIIEHSWKTAGQLVRRLKLNGNSLVLEIGSNDGVHLAFYKERGINVLGVDPAVNIAKVANDKGIPTTAEFFTDAFAGKLKKSGTSADLIYGANVTAHIPDIQDFVRGVKTLLKANGTAVFESPYAGGLFENKFDTIYHEHVFYYSLLALTNLFANSNLEIYDIEFVNMQGGSLRIYVSHPGVFTITKNVSDLLEKEKKQGLDKLSTYRKINNNIKLLRKELVHLLVSLKSDNKRIAAYGAPAKGIILLNYFKIHKYLDFIVDKSEAKQGLYTPGAHMKIFPIEKIEEEKPNFLLILPWNISEEIIKSLNEYKKQGGKFIIPIPHISII